MKNFFTSRPLFSRNLSININGHIMDLSLPRVMGIINTTPDSFYPGSQIPEPGKAVETAREMINSGAAILDIGAVSSRPGAEEVSQEEEISRLSPVLEALRSEFPDFPLSVDTWRSEVARVVHERYAVGMINDISAGSFDSKMIPTISELGIPYLMMHMQGSPDTMQDSPVYENIVDELLQFFGEKVHQLRKRGVNDIVIDPGFGFGKTLEQNYKLLYHLDSFQMMELPVMVGVSRKSMIYKTLDLEASDALNGTTAVHMSALLKGASLLRVHDVKEAVQTVKIFQQIVESRSNKV
jgi:dihydropteroate synthase